MAELYVAWPHTRPGTRLAYARRTVVNECLTYLRRRRPETATDPLPERAGPDSEPVLDLGATLELLRVASGGMPLVEVNGAQIWIEDSGAPAGRPGAEVVVFGHGVLFSGRSFNAQVQRLRDRYRCVRIDWRGQGRSPASRSGYDMDSLYLDAVTIIEQLGLGPVHCVGLSMGGFVGMRLAARRPDLVRSLVLLDTSAGPEPPENVSRYRMLTRVYGLLGFRPVRKPVERIMFGPTFLAGPRSRAEIDAWVAEVTACDKAGITKAINGVVDRLPVDGEIGRITAPTLVAVGTDDVATPLPKSEAIAAAIPGARLELIPDAGHSSSIEQPERVADLLEKWLDAS